MDQVLLGLLLLCSPFEAKSGAGFVVQHNCNPVNIRFLDETFERAMKTEPEWVRQAIPVTTRIVVATYYVQRDCWPTVLWAVVPALYGEAIVIHPDVFRDFDEGALGRALHYRAWVLQWWATTNAGELHGCLQ